MSFSSRTKQSNSMPPSRAGRKQHASSRRSASPAQKTEVVINIYDLLPVGGRRPTRRGEKII
jgi:hypothetical protein